MALHQRTIKNIGPTALYILSLHKKKVINLLLWQKGLGRWELQIGSFSDSSSLAVHHSHVQVSVRGLCAALALLNRAHDEQRQNHGAKSQNDVIHINCIICLIFLPCLCTGTSCTGDQFQKSTRTVFLPRRYNSKISLTQECSLLI